MPKDTRQRFWAIRITYIAVNLDRVRFSKSSLSPLHLARRRVRNFAGYRWDRKILSGHLDSRRGLLKVALWSLPMPWIAIEVGWFVAEYGRQPWVIEGVLPTYYAASGLTIADLAISLTIFLVLYTVLLIIGVKVMLHAVRKGPKSDAPVPVSAPADPVHAAVRA